jgi:hypothetical protein
MGVARRGRPGKLPILACAAALLLSLGWYVARGDGASSRRPPPVAAVRLVQPGQYQLLASGRLEAEVRGRGTSPVRVSLLSRVAGARGLRTLAPSQKMRLVRGRTTSVSLGLTPPGASLIASCDPQVLILRVSPLRRGRFRTVDHARTLRTDPPACGQFFAADSVWNAPLAADASLDPNSAAVTAELVRQVREGYAGNLQPTINTTQYSAPIYTVPAGQRPVRVILDKPPGVATELARAFEAVPVPDHALPAPGTDAQLVVWQPATDTMWEFWRMRRGPDGWHAGWGGRMTDASSSAGVYQGSSWGATATSLPLAGGLITVPELRRRRIDHALALAIPSARRGEFSLPAQRTDGRSASPDSVPEGARFRLDPRLDLDRLGLPPVVLAIARAAQRYGMIVRDRAGAVVLYAEDPRPLGWDPYPQLFGGSAPRELLRAFPWEHLQLMAMQLRSEGDRPSPIERTVCGAVACE